MSWNGAGVFNRIYSWVADKNAAINITASRMDTDTNDIVSNGFGNTLTRDGQGNATANLPMNGFRHTGVGNGVARSDYASLGQVEDGVINWAVATGTSDAIAASQSPNVTALVDGQLSFFRATAANATAAPTYSLNGLTARTITKAGGTAVAPGDIPGNLAECIVRYNLANTRWELLNPATPSTAIINGTSNWIAAGGTADAITATYSPVVGSLVDGQLCFFRATASNVTTTPTFAPNGLTAHTITRKGGGALLVGDIPGNLAECIVRYNLANTRWELLNPAATPSGFIPGGFKNLSIKVATTTTVAIAADFVTTTDGTNFQATAVNATCNLGSAGAVNALDAGTIAIDTWYHIWVVAKPDGTTGTLASTSSTAPTMPTGYTYKARIGAVQTIHATATLYGTWQFGRRASYVVGLAQTANLPIMISGSSGSVSVPTWTAQSIARFVPPTASLIDVMLFGSVNSASSVMAAPNNSYGNQASTSNPPPLQFEQTNASTMNLNVPSTFLIESANVYYASNAGAGSGLACRGWEDNI